jgi:Spy/CpxP family protein refolding chaperone
MKRMMMLLVVLAIAGPLSASEFDLPPGKWWENPRLVNHIGLTEEQQEQIRGLVYEHAKVMIDLNADVKRAGLDLAEVVDRDDFDPVPVRSAFAVFQTARQKLENERFEMLLAVRQVLTTEQWRKIQEIKQRIQQNRQQRQPGQRPAGQHPQGERNPGF